MPHRSPRHRSPTRQGRARRAPWLAPYRWQPGQSGNPSGRLRESGSLAAALRRVGIKPAGTRAELTKIAQQLGMDPEEAQNIDVIAGLIYDGITQLLIRTVKGNTGAGDKLVGLLQLLFKALDGDERRITLNGPGDLQAALTRVSAVLGFQATIQPHGLRHTHAAQLRGEGVDIAIISRQLGHASIATTARYLDHIAPRAVIEAMRSWTGA